jgi:hypothetical protein
MDAQGGAFLENGRGAGNFARSRLSGGSWAMSEPSWSAEGRLKAGCSQDLGTCKIPDPEPLVGGVGTKQKRAEM